MYLCRARISLSGMVRIFLFHHARGFLSFFPFDGCTFSVQYNVVAGVFAFSLFSAFSLICELGQYFFFMSLISLLRLLSCSLMYSLLFRYAVERVCVFFPACIFFISIVFEFALNGGHIILFSYFIVS